MQATQGVGAARGRLKGTRRRKPRRGERWRAADAVAERGTGAFACLRFQRGLFGAPCEFRLRWPQGPGPDPGPDTRFPSRHSLWDLGGPRSERGERSAFGARRSTLARTRRIGPWARPPRWKPPSKPCHCVAPSSSCDGRLRLGSTLGAPARRCARRGGLQARLPSPGCWPPTTCGATTKTTASSKVPATRAFTPIRGGRASTSSRTFPTTSSSSRPWAGSTRRTATGRRCDGCLPSPRVDAFAATPAPVLALMRAQNSSQLRACVATLTLRGPRSRTGARDVHHRGRRWLGRLFGVAANA